MGIIECEKRIATFLADNLVLRKWTMGRTNFQCDACDRSHFPAEAIYISAAFTIEEIKEDPAATCEMVLGSACAKKIKGISQIEKL